MNMMVNIFRHHLKYSFKNYVGILNEFLLAAMDFTNVFLGIFLNVHNPTQNICSISVSWKSSLFK